MPQTQQPTNPNLETYFEFQWSFLKKLLHSYWGFGAQYLLGEAPAARIE